MSETSDILIERRGPVATVTFNRPEARNAFTLPMYRRLADGIAALAGDPEVRAIVLTGAGGKAFASGTDIGHFRTVSTPEDAVGYERFMEGIFGTIERCPVPTIAAIAGACTGGGAAIAALCDLRIATADLRFGFPIARTLGNCLSTANYRRLAALVGPSRVKEMVLTARLLSADEARSAGFVSEILPDHGALMARAQALGEIVAGHAPLTMMATKEALRRVRDSEREDDDDLVIACYTSDDFKEGMDAFLSKRAPVWRGK
jgi:enoyl-CoA hydratase